MTGLQRLILLLVAGGIALFFFLDLGAYLQLESLRSELDRMQTLRQDSPWVVIVLYLSIYIGVTALSLPGAAVLTLASVAPILLAKDTSNRPCQNPKTAPPAIFLATHSCRAVLPNNST